MPIIYGSVRRWGLLQVANYNPLKFYIFLRNIVIFYKFISIALNCLYSFRSIRFPIINWGHLFHEANNFLCLLLM